MEPPTETTVSRRRGLCIIGIAEAPKPPQDIVYAPPTVLAKTILGKCPVPGCNYSAGKSKNPANSMNSHLLYYASKDDAHAVARRSFTMKGFTAQLYRLPTSTSSYLSRPNPTDPRPVSSKDQRETTQISEHRGRKKPKLEKVKSMEHQGEDNDVVFEIESHPTSFFKERLSDLSDDPSRRCYATNCKYVCSDDVENPAVALVAHFDNFINEGDEAHLQAKVRWFHGKVDAYESRIRSWPVFQHIAKLSPSAKRSVIVTEDNGEMLGEYLKLDKTMIAELDVDETNAAEIGNNSFAVGTHTKNFTAESIDPYWGPVFGKSSKTPLHIKGQSLSNRKSGINTEDNGTAEYGKVSSKEDFQMFEAVTAELDMNGTRVDYTGSNATAVDMHNSKLAIEPIGPYSGNIGPLPVFEKPGKKSPTYIKRQSQSNQSSVINVEENQGRTMSEEDMNLMIILQKELGI